MTYYLLSTYFDSFYCHNNSSLNIPLVHGYGTQ